MSKELRHLEDYVNNVSDEIRDNEAFEYSEREVLELLKSYKKKSLICYEIKMSSCSDEDAEVKVSSYLSSITK